MAETHWAFIAPRRPNVPDVKTHGWVRNPIDRFVLRQLEEQGLDPSPEADRATLLRRVSLDLTGLPPSPEETAEFRSDQRPDAYERAVDRLLASPHHGERWGRHWLDQARYADSNGFNIDAPRSIWKYRDWVITALNRDMPFDRFVIDQIAGDLKPGASFDDKIATGFHRNTQINQEGGIDVEQFRDRVDRRSRQHDRDVFLGLTVGCAQCHDHKYDPISQREYYRLFAFFNNVDEPELEIATPEAKKHRDEVVAAIDAFHRDLAHRYPDLDAREARWEATADLAFKQAQTRWPGWRLTCPASKRTEAAEAALIELMLAHERAFEKDSSCSPGFDARQPKFITTMVVSRTSRPSPRDAHPSGRRLHAQG